MLLTHLLSLNIKLEADANSIDTQVIFDALRTLRNKESSVIIHNQYRIVAKTATELNAALWELIAIPENLVTESMLLRALSHPDPFANFDEQTWAMLHIACNRKGADVAGIYQWIYCWLSAHPTSENAMQARLFLMSQPGFDLKSADAHVVVQPILASNDHWALLALLSHSAFDVKSLSQQNRNQLGQSMSAMITTTSQTAAKYAGIKGDLKSDLWAFVRYSGIGLAQKEALLNNIVGLEVETQLQTTCTAKDLTALIKIGSAVENITERSMRFLASIGVKLINGWSLELTQKQLAELEGKSSTTQEMILKDKRKENAITISQQFTDLIAVPRMLDNILTGGDVHATTAKINEVFNCYFDFFSRVIFNTLWLVSPRVCSNASVDWLLSLDAFRELRFLSLDPTKKSFSDGYVQSIFKAGDAYFIEKLFVLNRNLEHKPLFAAINQLLTYGDKMSEGVTRLLHEPSFNIAEYYEKSSEAFKALPQVNTAMQLQRIVTFSLNTSPEKRRPSVMGAKAAWEDQLKAIKEDAIKNFDAEMFASELVSRYLPDLHELTRLVGVKNSSAAEKEVAYKKIKRIYELVKLVRNRSPEIMTETLNKNNIFLQFVLNYRIERYASEKETLKDLLKDGFAAFFREEDVQRLKDSKIEFLRYLSQFITTTQKEREGLGRASTPMQLVHKLYCPINKKTGEKIADVNGWLTGMILHGKKTAQTLALLPDHLLEEIFRGANLNEPGETLTNAKAIEKRAFGRVFNSDQEKNAAINRLDHDNEDSMSVISGDDVASATASLVGTASSSSSGVDLAQGYTKGNKTTTVFGMQMPTLGFGSKK